MAMVANLALCGAVSAQTNEDPLRQKAIKAKYRVDQLRAKFSLYKELASAGESESKKLVETTNGSISKELPNALKIYFDGRLASLHGMSADLEGINSNRRAGDLINLGDDLLKSDYKRAREFYEKSFEQYEAAYKFWDKAGGYYYEASWAFVLAIRSLTSIKSERTFDLP
jgi:hypothetical protein